VKPVGPVSQLNNLSPKKNIVPRVFFKIHRRAKNEILAICDENFLGKTLFNEKSSMRVPSKFYKGSEISAFDALQLIKSYNNINIIGSVINLGLEKNLISEDAVIWFSTKDGDKVPHLLIFSMPYL